jgi:hypothetical protein
MGGLTTRYGFPYTGFYKPPPAVSGGAAAFSPTSISGLQLWLDFSDISTLFQDAAKKNLYYTLANQKSHRSSYWKNL